MASCTKHGEWPLRYFACPKCFEGGDVSKPIRDDKRGEALEDLDRRIGALRLKYGADPNETLEEWIARLYTPSASGARSSAAVARDAIDLFLEYRDKHGHNEEGAKAAALNEFDDADHFAPSATVAFIPTHRHVSGGLYRFVQDSRYKPRSGMNWTEAVIYEGEDHKVYVTTPARWADSFVPLDRSGERNDR